MAIVEIDGLGKRFKHTTALKNVNLSINQGEVFGIVGPDGAGKTTLLRIVTGIMRPTEGSIRVANIDIVQNPEAVKEKIGVVPQNFSLYPDLTTEENLDFFSRIYQLNAAVYRERRDRLLRITRLAPFMKRRAEHLSGGMQKKLALVTCLLHTPELLFLDEPTTGVDPVSRRELWDFLYELLATSITIIVSTPYMDEAERCSRVGFIYKGNLLLVDNPLSMKKTYPYKVYEFRTGIAQARDVQPWLAVANVADAYPVADTVHLITKDELTDKTKKQLEKTGVYGIKLIEPSFEDIFIAVIRSRQ